VGGNTSLMVQAGEEIKVFLEVFRKYNFQDIIMLSVIILLTYFLILRKEIQTNVQKVFHSVVSSGFISLLTTYHIGQYYA